MPDDAVLLAAVISPLLGSGISSAEYAGAAEDFIDELCRTSRLPHRIAEGVRKMIWAEGVLTGKLRRKRSLRSFRQHPDFQFGMKLLEIHAESSETLRAVFESWSRGEIPEQIIQRSEKQCGSSEKKGDRHRRRGGSRRRGSRNSAAQSEQQAGESPETTAPSKACAAADCASSLKKNETEIRGIQRKDAQLSFDF